MILQKYPWLKYTAALGLLLTVVGLTFANTRFVGQTTAGSDFLPFWSASRAWLQDGIGPYAADVQREAELLVYGRAAMPSLGEPGYAFLYPFPAIFLTLPYGLLEYANARAIWMTVLEIALPLSALLLFGARRWKTPPQMIAVVLLFSFLWIPGFSGLISGQVALLIVLLLSAALLAAQREAYIAAGVFLGLATLKPQLSGLLVLFYLVWGIGRRRWSLLLSFLATCVSLWLLTLFLETGWLLGWARAIAAAASDGMPTRSALHLFAGLFPSVERPLYLGLLGLAALSLVWEWGSLLAADDRSLPWVAAYTAVISIFIAPPLNIADQVLLIVPVIMLVDYSGNRWKERSTPINLILLAGLAVVSWLPVVLGTLTTELTLFSYILPLLILIGIRWSRWWARHALDWWDGNLLG